MTSVAGLHEKAVLTARVTDGRVHATTDRIEALDSLLDTALDDDNPGDPDE